MARRQPQDRDAAPHSQPAPRTVHPITAVGFVLIAAALSGLAVYLLLTWPARLPGAGDGPPAEFVAAATRQAMLTPSPTTAGATALPAAADNLESDPAPLAEGWPTPTLLVAVPEERITPTANPVGDWPLPDYVETAYWLSIPDIGVEAPVIAMAPFEREVDGFPVLRLPVPNSYSVAWDSTSAEPGFAGNTILTGHHNVYGGVFRLLHELTMGAEVALWSDLGVFSYHVVNIIYLEEDDQPLSVRQENAHWLDQTVDDRVTLITCWPHSTSTHRLVVVATR